MTSLATPHIQKGERYGSQWLRRSGQFWFIMAAAGQLAFIGFIVLFYGSRTLAGAFENWNDKPLIDGYIAGDAIGNLMFILHVGFATILTLGGLLQVVPALRKRSLVFHRWNGRVFVVIALYMALGGLWLGWVRGTHLSLISAYMTSLNGVLIIACVIMAWRMAVARNIAAHHRWAMRAFLAVNGVWFFRVEMMAWVILSQGGYGMNASLSGPADIAIQFGSYVLPLMILELYFYAKRVKRPAIQIPTAMLISLCAIVTAIGVYGTVTILWGPHM